MIHILMAAALQAAAPPAPAQVAPQPPRPVLATEFVDYFTGNWSGSGHFVRSGKPVASTFSFRLAHDHETLIVDHAEIAPNKFSYSGIISLDSGTGKPVFLMASNNKGGARLFRSDGWQDGKLVFTADPALRAWFAQERITFLRTGDKAFKATYEMSFDNGANWRTGDEQSFAKE